MRCGRVQQLWKNPVGHGRAMRRAILKHARRVGLQAAEARARYTEQAQLHAADLRRIRGGQCGRKKRYERQSFAEKLRDRWRARGVELEVYPCPHCLGYHLTHQAEPASVARSG